MKQLSEKQLFKRNLAVRRRALEMRLPDALTDIKHLFRTQVVLARSSGLELYKERVGLMSDVIAEFENKYSPKEQSVILPTPEFMNKTAGRLSHDPIRSLVAKGVLDNGEERYADEIQYIFESLTRALAPKGGSLEPRSGGSGQFSDIRMSWSASDLYSSRYKPWVKEMRKRDLPVPLVLDIVVSGIPLRRVREMYHASHSTVITILKEALSLYRRLAEW